MHQIKLTDNIYYLGCNDRRTELFENLWPIPNGVSYNSYLIVDDKVTLIDTIEKAYIDDYLDKIEGIIGDREVDYLVVNHMEPDHSGALRSIMAKYPNITIVGNKKTFGLIEAFYAKDIKSLEVADGHILETGNHRLQFQTIPMVHWPETMVSFEENNGVLFSGDAFGSFGTLDGGVFDDEINLSFYENDLMRYFTNIVGKYCPHTQRAIKKIANLDVKQIAPTHGPIWRSDINWVMSRYDKWSRYQTEQGCVIVYGSMYGNTQKMAEAIARQLSVRGIKNIRVYDASKTHKSYIINDLFRYKGFIVGSCAYNNELFPKIQNLLSSISHLGVKDHYLGVFGSFAWSGGGVKNLMKFAEASTWELVHAPVEEKGALKKEKHQECLEIANAMADKLQEKV